MARYRWVIRTKESWGAGTDAGVFLGLTGDKQRMSETELDDPDSVNDWEAGDINHGLIETEELGNLVSGTLRHNGKGAGSDWTVDYVRVWNDDDGRSWFAQVNKTLKGQETLRLKFRQEADVRTDGMEDSAESPVKRQPKPQPVFLSTPDDAGIVPAALSRSGERGADAEPAALSRPSAGQVTRQLPPPSTPSPRPTLRSATKAAPTRPEPAPQPVSRTEQPVPESPVSEPIATEPAVGDQTDEATLARLRAEGLSDDQIQEYVTQQKPLMEGTPYASVEGTPLMGEPGEFGTSFEPFRVMEPIAESEATPESAPNAESVAGTESAEVWA